MVDCEEQNHAATNKSSIFEILKLKTKRRSQFLSSFWRHHHRNHHQTQNNSSYSRLNASRTNSALTIDNQNYVKSQLPYDAIQMQCLDVGSLLKMNERRDYKRLQYDSTTEGTPSFAGSSLDLQWEHEYDDDQPYPPYSWQNSQDDLSSSESEENGCSIEMSQITSSSNAKLNQQNNNNYQPVVTSNRKINRNRLQNRNRCSSTSQAENETKFKSNNSWSHISTPESLEWDVHDDDSKFKSEDDLMDRETMELLNEIEWLKNRALVETGDTQWKPEQGNS